MASTPIADIVEEARRVVALAEERNVRARLIGGLAVLTHAHSPLPATVARTYGDIDLVVRRREGQALQQVMADAGYGANVRFNALHGEKRLMFLDEANERRLDVFVGKFEMCHALDLDDRLPAEGSTLALADLLLTKLQVVQLNAKDVVDALTVLRDHPVEESADLEVINVASIREVCANDWGWFTTVGDNLERLEAAAPEILPGEDAEVRDRIARIKDDIVGAKKSTRWKMRSKVGRRAPWYELPEEV